MPVYDSVFYCVINTVLFGSLKISFLFYHTWKRHKDIFNRTDLICFVFVCFVCVWGGGVFTWKSKVKGEAFFSSGTFAAQKFSFRIIGDSKLTDVNVMGRLSVLALNALELDLIKTDRMKLGESSHHHGADDHQSMSVRDTETC